MTSQKGLIHLLKTMENLLVKERSALIGNDVEEVSEIVNKKNEIIQQMHIYKGMDIKNFKEAMDLIEEINSMQELNLLLTKQALSFQNALLESISKNMNNFSNTYSSKGAYETMNNINIIDQSV